ncbi:TonB-dependent receptor [Pseudomaricurvus alkylphenolicus]|jgi:iron complex outermembrane receptor protein|uniref:TonB-dependent receptor n=1 Tax=Pseudomaricurvus alkylphenolicus TaxID=1306991 RepID=UPI00141E5EAF|nr:TonB-dependent receptor [Pseudomaricurvus alkylphenolicus]NIB40075.1 TonB-dependent receptor [Pseudomaricurvus alkylphenolicus]
MNISRLKQPIIASVLGLSAFSPTLLAAVIEEVIVTVQKREQTLQEVPVAVSAFEGDMMAKMGIGDVRGLVDLTPGFNGKTEDSFIDALAIRGIGTNDFGIGGDPSVAIFQDGIWAGRNGGVQMAFYDLARAEVVKGPQSTLFGRNAIAGGINILSNKPVDEFEGNISLTIAEYGEIEAVGTVNLPLTDSLYFRGSAYWSEADGWLDNTVDGKELGEKELSSTRLALRYAGDEVDAVFRLTYEDREQAPSVYWTPTNGLPEDKVASDLSGEGFDRGEILTVTANITWDLAENYTLVSTTGYKTYDFDYLEDFDGTALYVNNYGQSQEVDYFSQEFRLNYDGGGDITWFAGASIYRETVDATFTNAYNEDHLCIAIIETDEGGGAAGCDDPVFEAYWEDDIDPADILTDKAEVNINELESDGWSVYGDVTWQATADLDITIGGRYTVDNKEMKTQVLDSGGALGNTFSWEFYTDGFVEDDDSWSEFTPRIAANYMVNEDIGLYANYSKGYKTGGYSTFGIANDGTFEFGGQLEAGMPLAFEPEETDSYEVGAKTKLLDGSLHLNVAYFFYTYTDLQLIIFESGSQLVKNLGEAENQGIEMDAHWTPGENWDIRAAFAWQDSEITEEIEEGDGSKGNHLPMAPEVSGSLIATYNQPVSGGNMFYTVQYVYQDEMFGGTGNFDLAKVDAWDQVDLRLGYESDDEWSLTLWATNIFEEEYFERGWENADEDDTAGFGLLNSLVWPAKPRTIGLTLDMSF